MPRRARAWLPAGVCLVGFDRDPRTMLQADAARAALPPYAARAAQPPTQAVLRFHLWWHETMIQSD